MVGYKDDKNLNLRLGKETKGLQVEYHWMGRVRVDKKIFRAPWWWPSLILIKDSVVLVLDEKVSIVYWHMRDLGGLIILVASLIAWSNSNRYSMVDVGGRMR
jgi:hypothetical protein